MFPVTLRLPQGAEPITVAMTADHWQAKENAESLREWFFSRLDAG